MPGQHQLLIFVVFCHKTNELTFQTALECKKAVENIQSPLKFGFVFIDDGSQDELTTLWIDQSIALLREIPNIIVTEKICHSHRLGLAASINSAVEFLVKCEVAESIWVTQLPGNDQVSSESLKRFFEHPLENELCVLWRANLNDRPWAKRFASKALQKLVNAFLFPQIMQVTANFVAPVDLYKQWLVPSSGHAYGLWLLFGATKEGIPVVQREFTLKKRRDNHGAVRKTPKIQDIVSVINQLVRVKLLMRKTLR